MTDSIIIREFCAQQREWLKLELQSEQDEVQDEEFDKNKKLSRNSSAGKGVTSNNENNDGIRSHVLHQLEVNSISVGLYGRTVVQLTSLIQQQQQQQQQQQDSSSNNKNTNTNVLLLPAHRFTTGDEVEIRDKSDKKHNNYPTGVISEVTDTSISVALFPSSKKKQYQQQNNDGDDDESNDTVLQSTPLSIIPKSNIEVHKKLMLALDEIEKYGTNHPICGKIIHAMFFNDHHPSFAQTTTPNTTTSSSSISDNNANNKFSIQPYNTNLDDSQLEAISFALCNNNNTNNTIPISLIHGPPGTGKTTTITELIHQAVYANKWKVLVTAPSNVAVDNVLSKLVSNNKTSTSTNKTKSKQSSTTTTTTSSTSSLRVVRLGHPARLQPNILPYSLEALVQSADGTEIVADVRAELQSYLQFVNNSNTNNRNNKKQHQQHSRSGIKQGGGKLSNNNNYTDKYLAYREIKSLRKEIRVREEKVVKELIDHANVILATCVGSASKILQQYEFDLIIIDEAAQALEVACWIPILKGKTKIVLAGDHYQLPPTILSNNPIVQKGLSTTMFERLMKLYNDDSSYSNNNNYDGKSVGGHISRMLKVQYRMNEKISNWASQALYGGELISHETVRHRTLSQLLFQTNNNRSNTNTNDDDDNDDMISKQPLVLIDTAGCGMYESTNAAGSRYNDGEAQLVQHHVTKLLELGVQQDQIAIITPYNGQVEKLRLAMLPNAPKLQIRSVDGFQGGEREAVVLSLVRSSDRSHGGAGSTTKNGSGIGFLRDDRRLNVAITRAKRHCCIICDTETVCQSPFIQNLIHWVEKYGEQRSAIEFIQEHELEHDIAQAELEILKLIEEEAKTTISTTTRSYGSSHFLRNSINDKGIDQNNKPIKVSDAEIEERRITLLPVIKAFQETNEAGSQMVLNAELSKLDRKIVHEIAEELGLEHVSDGTEGVNRRITLSIPKNEVVPTTDTPSLTTNRPIIMNAPPGQQPTDVIDTLVHNSDALSLEGDDGSENDDGDVTGIPTSAASFSVLQEIGHEEEEEEECINDMPCTQDKEEVVPTMVAHDSNASPPLNSTLGDLAKEREKRRKEQEKRQQSSVSNHSLPKKKGPSKKGQKLGGKPKSNPAPSANVDVNYIDNLDDMAFLDAQIEKVQTSHGRNIEGTGKAYRTVMNGILLPKPKIPAERKRDPKTASALQKKIKSAQDDRKSKTKKK